MGGKCGKRKVLWKMFSFILALTLLQDLMAYAAEADGEIGTEASASSESAFSGGEGTAENPYQIETAEQLNHVRNNLSACYILMNDIDLSGINWVPIGDGSNGFEGSFDGKDYSIHDLRIDAETDEDACLGLFAYTAEDAMVSNINLDGEIYEIASLGNAHIGGIAGQNDGIIDHCLTNMTIDAVANENGHRAITGGISGLNYGEIINSGTCVTLSSEATGTGSYADGIAGGISGENYGTVANCYSRGEITTVDGVGSYAGGITGWTSGSVYNSYSLCIASAYGHSSSSYIKKGGISAVLDGILDSCYWHISGCESICEWNRGGGTSSCASFNDELSLSGANEYSTLLEALNAWVDNNDPVKYRAWAMESYEGSDYPAFGKTAASISDATITLSSNSYTYDGTAKTPAVTVQYGSTTLTEGTDYTVEYSDNTEIGTATVTVTGIGDYEGTETLSFTIEAAEDPVSTVTAISLEETASGSLDEESSIIIYGSVDGNAATQEQWNLILQSIEWENSEPSVAEIEGLSQDLTESREFSLVLTPKSAGTTMIRGTVNGLTVSCEVTVTGNAEEPKIVTTVTFQSPYSIIQKSDGTAIGTYVVRCGESIAISATIRSENPVDAGSLTWNMPNVDGGVAEISDVEVSETKAGIYSVTATLSAKQARGFKLYLLTKDGAEGVCCVHIRDTIENEIGEASRNMVEAENEYIQDLCDALQEDLDGYEQESEDVDPAKALQDRDAKTNDKIVTMESDTPDDALYSVYQVLAESFDEYFDDALDDAEKKSSRLSYIKFSDSQVEIAVSIVNDVAAKVESLDEEQTIGNYKVKIHMTGYAGAGTGNVVVTDKTTKKEYQGYVGTTREKTTEVLKDYMESMSDVVNDMMIQYLESTITEATKFIGLEKLSTEAIQECFEEISTYLSTFYGDVQNFLVISYDVYELIKKSVKFADGDMVTQIKDADKFLNYLDDVDFASCYSEKGIKARAVKDAMDKVSSAEKKLNELLSEYVESVKEGKTGLKSTAQCPVDVTVYDEDGSALCSYQDGILMLADESAGVEIEVSGDVKTVFTPEEFGGTIAWNGTGDGTMNLHVERLVAGAAVETLNYYDVPLSDSTVYIQDMSFAKPTGNGESFVLTPSDGAETIAPSECLDLTEEDSTVTVICQATQGGAAYGTGTYVKGTSAIVTAYAESGYTFEGWYESDSLVTDSIVYRFTAKDSRTLEARFRVKTTEELEREEDADESNVCGCTVFLEQQAYAYTGEECRPAVTVKKTGVMLEEGTDYTVSYENNVEPGQASVLIAGIGTYSGSTRRWFEIVQDEEQTESVKICAVTLDSSALVDASASVSADEAQAGSEITILITPNSGHAFSVAPTVIIDRQTAETARQEDGSYLCRYTIPSDADADVVVAVSGEAKASDSTEDEADGDSMTGGSGGSGDTGSDPSNSDTDGNSPSDGTDNGSSGNGTQSDPPSGSTDATIEIDDGSSGNSGNESNIDASSPGDSSNGSSDDSSSSTSNGNSEGGNGAESAPSNSSSGAEGDLSNSSTGDSTESDDKANGASSGGVTAAKAQKITVSKKKQTFTAKQLKKKKRTFKIGADTSGNGKLTCKKVSGSAKLRISRTGKVMVKKGTKKGTYKMKVKITAAGTSRYRKATRTITVKVKVK